MRLSVVLLVTALAATACAKKAQPGGPETGLPGQASVAQAPFNVKMLGLELASPSAGDVAVPSSELYQGGIAALDPLYAEAVMVLNHTLSLTSKDQGPFLVWPEGEGRHKIAAAFFAVRSQGGDNQMTGDPDYDVATPDHELKRFFIPIRKALSRRIQDLGPADEQILSLRLQFVEGGTTDLTLRFRVAGPLLPIQTVSDEQLRPGINDYTFFHVGGAIPLRRMTFQNPMARPVALWFRPVRESLILTGRFRARLPAGLGAMNVNWNQRIQLADLSVSQRGAQRHLAYPGSEPGGWSVIHFEPGERADVEWSAAVRGCGGVADVEYVGVTADGSWEIETWVTDDSHPALPREFQALLPSMALATAPVSTSTHHQVGDWGGETAGGVECQ